MKTIFFIKYSKEKKFLFKTKYFGNLEQNFIILELYFIKFKNKHDNTIN